MTKYGASCTGRGWEVRSARAGNGREYLGVALKVSEGWEQWEL